MSRKDNDMKKNYENPKVEIIEIGMKDVITVSGKHWSWDTERQYSSSFFEFQYI